MMDLNQFLHASDMCRANGSLTRRAYSTKRDIYLMVPNRAGYVCQEMSMVYTIQGAFRPYTGFLPSDIWSRMC